MRLRYFKAIILQVLIPMTLHGQCLTVFLF